VSRLDGAHRHGTDPAELVGALAAVAAVAALIWFLLTIIWILAAIAGVFIPAAIFGLIWLARHGGDMAVVSRGLPVSQRASLPQASRQPLPPPRPVQALPAPPVINYSPLTVNNNFFVMTPEQAAELAARREIEGR
jgi:hypothetical protein